MQCAQADRWHILLNKTELCALGRGQDIHCHGEFIMSIYPETSRDLCFSQHGKARHFRSRYLIL